MPTAPLSEPQFVLARAQAWFRATAPLSMARPAVIKVNAVRTQASCVRSGANSVGTTAGHHERSFGAGSQFASLSAPGNSRWM